MSCRNVLIYFKRELQDRAVGLFHEALCRRGFLGIGSKESLRWSAYATAFDEVARRGSDLPEAGRGWPSRSITDRIEAVVIGTSAGGVEALSALLPALPAGVCAPVFVVLHLPRERPSLLVDIFGPKCAVPVREAVDKDPIEPGTVYFAPPDYHLLIDDGPTIALSDDEPVHHSRPSVDVLFESAADAFGPGAARASC